MKYAVLRVRGARKVAPRIKRTLELLRLEKPNHCVLVDDTPQYVGMLEHAKDYVTYGPVDEKTICSLLEKRGTKGSATLRELKADTKKMAKEISAGKRTDEFADPVFRLNPPSRGYRDLKVSYPRGELGRREDMGPLLRRMM
ncbi:MAG: uL30 family ribosomal protein [Candidatus Micrarchaeota archaeon]